MSGAILDNFWGAETGDLLEVSSTAGSPSATSTGAISGGYSYSISGSTDVITLDPFDTQYGTGSDPIVVGFKIDGDLDAVRLEVNDNSSYFFALTITSGGVVQLRNSSNSVVGSSAASTCTDNTVHFIEIWADVGSPTAGEGKVWVDGTEVISVTSQDFDGGGSTLGTIEFSNNSASNSYLFDDVYYMHECGIPEGDARLGHEAIDNNGPTVICYRSNLASTTPDVGDVADAGNWANTQEVPTSDTNLTELTGAGAYNSYVNMDDLGGATAGGPSGDSNITGHISGIKGIYRVARSGGSSTTTNPCLGPADATSGISYDSVSGDLSAKSVQGNFLRFKPDGTKLWTASSNTGAGNVYIREFALSTAWDLSTIDSGTDSADLTNELNDADDIWWSNDGAKLLVLSDATNAQVSRYSCSTPWDSTTATFDTGETFTTIFVSNPSAFHFYGSPEGQYVVIHDFSDGDATSLKVGSGNYDLSGTITPLDTMFIASSSSYRLAPDGVNATVIKNTNELNLIRNFTKDRPHTGWEQLETTDLSTTPSTATSFDWNADGTKIYILGSDDKIYQWTMDVPYIPITPRSAATGQVNLAAAIALTTTVTTYIRTQRDRTIHEDDTLQLGWSKGSGGQDSDIYEMLGMSLHVPGPTPLNEVVPPITFMQRKPVKHMLMR